MAPTQKSTLKTTMSGHKVIWDMTVFVFLDCGEGGGFILLSGGFQTKVTSSRSYYTNTISTSIICFSLGPTTSTSSGLSSFSKSEYFYVSLHHKRGSYISQIIRMDVIFWLMQTYSNTYLSFCCTKVITFMCNRIFTITITFPILFRMGTNSVQCLFNSFCFFLNNIQTWI